VQGFMYACARKKGPRREASLRSRAGNRFSVSQTRLDNCYVAHGLTGSKTIRPGRACRFGPEKTETHELTYTNRASEAQPRWEGQNQFRHTQAGAIGRRMG
jgi:hypothetical protein